MNRDLDGHLLHAPSDVWRLDQDAPYVASRMVKIFDINRHSQYAAYFDRKYAACFDLFAIGFNTNPPDMTKLAGHPSFIMHGDVPHRPASVGFVHEQSATSNTGLG